MSEQPRAEELVAELRATNNRPEFAQIYMRHLAQRAADEIERLTRKCHTTTLERYALQCRVAEIVAHRRSEHPPQLMAVVDYWQEAAAAMTDRACAAVVEDVLMDIRRSVVP